MTRNTARAVLVALVVSACTEGSGDALEGGTDVPAMCKAWCQQQSDCYADAFEADYGSLEQCRTACEQEAGAFYDGYHAPECADEALAKDICVAGLSCAQLDAVDYSACEDEILALVACLGAPDGGV